MNVTQSSGEWKTRVQAVGNEGERGGCGIFSDRYEVGGCVELHNAVNV